MLFKPGVYPIQIYTTGKVTQKGHIQLVARFGLEQVFGFY